MAGTSCRSALGRVASCVAALGLIIFTLVLTPVPALAGNAAGFPRTFVPETAAGFTNTFTTNQVLSPQCPQALAGTPGSDPASKVLNQSLNTPASFTPGGTVHFTYVDNPHTNGGTNNFTIQDCLVVYPSGFFPPGSVDPSTGLITGSISKSMLISGGTPIDGASLSGISAPTGPIYFGWTSHDVVPGDWVCNFARDIANNHGGGGNRKVPPACFQVASPPSPGLALPPQVFVGYADSDHANSVPSPWQGATTNASGGPLQFVGCNFHSPDVCLQGNVDNGGDVYDSGALLINNVSTDGSSITITGGSVSIGSCLFQPWMGVDATIPAGGSLILTQTGGPAPALCAPAIGLESPLFNFDTSEFPNEAGTPPYGILPGNTASQCNIDNGLIPKIQLTYTSSNAPSTVLTANFSDTGQVLNTGGFDLGVCTTSGDEFHAWSGPLGP